MQGRSAADRIRSKTFTTTLWGYDRAAVDAWLVEIADLVERLEAQPAPRDAAVKQALDAVGQETAGILQRAHDAAEEIEARSRAQADGRLQRAEDEAQEIVARAEERAGRLEADTHRLWDERTRLLEEMRRFADEVLGVADDASERLRPPPTDAPPEEADEPAPFEAINELREELEAGEQPTVEVEVSRLDPEHPAPGGQPDAEPQEHPAGPGEQRGSAPDAGITRS